MRQFFDDDQMRNLVTKTIGDLTHPVGIDKSMTFTARRAKVLIAHVNAIGNIIGERVKQMFDSLDATYTAIDARVRRLESMLDEPRVGDPGPALVEDQVTQHGVRLDRLQQQLSSLSKQLSALERKTNR